MMLCRDPKKRITAEQALQHPWFGLITDIKLDSTIKKEQRVKTRTMKRLKKFVQANALRRCAIELLIKMLSDDEKQLYETEFNKFDTSRSGMISDKDFIAKIKESDEELNYKKIKNMIKELDYEENKQISYSDFLTATLDIKKVLTRERLKTIFSKFDQKDKNKVYSDGLRSVLDTYGFELSDKNCDELIQKYDQTDKGYINMADFEAMMLKA